MSQRLFAASLCTLFIAACGQSGEPDRENPTGIADAAATESTDDRDSVKEFAEWRKAQSTNTIEAYSAFIDAHPHGSFSDDAARRRRILELEPINLNVEVAAPEGTFMVQPLTMDSDGNPTPSGRVEAMPEGTTLTLTFTTEENGEEITEVIQATYDSAIARAMVFRNDDGLCLTRANLTGAVSYCDGEEPPPPDPADTRAMMVYAWLVTANEF